MVKRHTSYKIEFNVIVVDWHQNIGVCTPINSLYCYRFIIVSHN